MTREPAKKPDRHYLYTAAVQSVEADLKFFRRIYRKHNGEAFHHLREDFCGTAVLAHEWVLRNAANEAWCVDLDQETLDWGREHYGPKLGAATDRLHWVCGDVRETIEPKVDVVAALNFSYSVFKTRELLGGYFAKVRQSLKPGGMLFLDAWGGTEAMCEDEEKRRVDAETAFDGTKIPRFTYVWEQRRFNPVDHQIICHIHFRLRDGTRLRRAFTYDWRLWMLPELQELLLAAGFARTKVYIEGWDEDDEPDGVFRRKRYFENQPGWVAYVVAFT